MSRKRTAPKPKNRGPRVSLERQLGLLPSESTPAPKPAPRVEEDPTVIGKTRGGSMSAEEARKYLGEGVRVPTSRFNTEDFEGMMSQPPAPIGDRGKREVSRQLRGYVESAPPLHAQDTSIPPITAKDRAFYKSLSKKKKQ